MAIIKLTPNYVRLIKHIREHRNWSHQSISDFFDNLITRKHVNNICNNKSWKQVDTPSENYGRELYYRYLNEGKLE